MRVTKHTKNTSFTKEQLEKYLPCYEDFGHNRFYVDGKNGRIFSVSVYGTVYEIKGTDKINDYNRINTKIPGGYKRIKAHRFIHAVYFNNSDMAPDQPVHHINSSKGDNRVKNLLWCASERIHKAIHKIENHYNIDIDAFRNYLSNIAIIGKLFDQAELDKLMKLLENEEFSLECDAI